MEVLYWITAMASLAAVMLNIRKHPGCFWIWTGTNAVWVFADLRHGIYAQAALQAVYFGLSVYGILAWSTAKTADPADKSEVPSHEGTNPD